MHASVGGWICGSVSGWLGWWVCQWVGGWVRACVCACAYVHACLSNKIGDAVILCFVWYGACWCIFVLSYHILGKFGGGKFGKFDELSTIHQTKTIQISMYN